MQHISKERSEKIEGFLSRHRLEGASIQFVSQALTHRSYAFEHEAFPDNERLEFLGDAVIGCMAAEFLYRQFPNDPEGLLSKKKAFLVSRTELGRRGRELGLDALVLLGHGEESGGGRKRASIVGSALEALIAALHLEIPSPQLKSFVDARVFEPALPALRNESYLDYKSRLQELVQKRFQSLPRYVKTEEEGPAHERKFLVEVHIDGERLGKGEGRRIKTAENRAARMAYDTLNKDAESDRE